MNVKIKRIDESIPLPLYETSGSVGFDFLCRESVEVPPQNISLIPANVIIETPPDYMLLVTLRSSTPRKRGLLIPHGIGVIDQDYCGNGDEIQIQVYNFTSQSVLIERGDRIAQGIFVRIDCASWQEVQRMDQKTRGGFGSTDRSFEYGSEESLSNFKDHLKKYQQDIETTMIIYKNEDDCQSLQPLESADVIVLFTRRLNTKGEELERFKSYCNLGKPIVGVRTASHAYQNYLEFDRDVLGGSYAGHFGHGPIAHVQIKEENADHPILAGLPNFDSYGSLYKNPNNAKDITTLMTASTSEGNCEPVAWTRVHNGGRIFYTSLGHQQDFRVDYFLSLLTNAILWAGGRK